jgi:protein TonB
MKKEKKDKDFLHKPVYPGGIKAIRKLIREQLRYPEAARRAGIEGTVHLKYTIDHRGRVIGAKVISGIGGGCEEEAIRLVKLLKFEVPKNRKMRVLFHKKLQIHFKLPAPAGKQAGTAQPTSLHYQYIPKATGSPEKTEDSSRPGYTYTIDW